jgi:Carboxypeptidase regulatory-like domain
MAVLIKKIDRKRAVAAWLSVERVICSLQREISKRKLDFIDARAWRPVRLGALTAILIVGNVATNLPAQQPASAVTIGATLPSSPGSRSAVQAAGPQAPPSQSAASIAGTVRDSRGTEFAAVPVTLVGQDNAVNRLVTADDKGGFTFADLPAGTYRVKIYVAGLEPFASAPIVLGGGEKRELPVVAMRIATKNTTVDVSATLNDVAQAQVKEEETQRMLGFLPNYYTSYIWNAAPMTRKLKFNLALRTATDPVTFLVVAGVAGVEQAHKTFPGYGQGFEGYAKRYGASYADTVAGRMFSSAIFPVLLHQDPRYFYQGSGSTRSRLLYALVSTVVCRGDDGRLEPNYAHVFGSFAAAGLSNLYRAPEDRKASLTFRNGLIITGSGAVVNILREFLSRKLTANVPAFANGKP